MAWTAPISYVSGAVATSAGMNTYVKDNLAYLKGLLDGTGGAITVITPDKLQMMNDALFFLDKGAPSSNPRLVFDSTDYFYYDRSANSYNFMVVAAATLAISSAGKVTGSGFYSSGEFSLTTGGTTDISHGLPARPRFVAGYAHTATSTEDNKTVPVSIDAASKVAFTVVSSTFIRVVNNTGGTRYIHMYAML